MQCRERDYFAYAIALMQDSVAAETLPITSDYALAVSADAIAEQQADVIAEQQQVHPTRFETSPSADSLDNRLS